MRKTVVLFLVCFSSLLGLAQITVIGRSLLNGKPIAKGTLYVYSNGALTYTSGLSKQAEFMFKLDFGKIHKVFIQSPQCPLMHFEVVANTIPAEKYIYRMTYEFNAEMADKNDEDIDTSVFKNAFHRVIYNGTNRMIADTGYNLHFSKHILKKQNNIELRNANSELTIVGRLFSPELPDNVFYPVEIECLDAQNKCFRILSSDRLSTFAFCVHSNSKISQFQLSLKDSSLSGKTIQVFSNNSNLLFENKVEGQKCNLKLGEKGLQKLVDNLYQANIGGKIIIASQKEKKFYSERLVYLLNKRHTIVDKTTTNLLGAFVFNDIQPDRDYYIALDRTELKRGQHADILNKNDQFVGRVDSLYGNKFNFKFSSQYPISYNRLLVAEDELKMDIKGTIFGDNINNPIGRLKIILLNDTYDPIDSVITDDFGSFKFKYLPFLKRFYLDADNSDNILDVFQNILIYSTEDNLIKIMTHQKGSKFTYKPLSTEILSMREVEIEDPWFQLIENKRELEVGIDSIQNKLIVENILFENNKSELSAQSKEVLAKIILVLNMQKGLRIEIGAHTDSKGGEVENLKLSEQRAKAVHDYMIDAGIASDRLVSKGYGESQPLINCSEKTPCTEREHSMNRRIEFKIIKTTKTK